MTQIANFDLALFSFFQLTLWTTPPSDTRTESRLPDGTSTSRATTPAAPRPPRRTRALLRRPRGTRCRIRGSWESGRIRPQSAGAGDMAERTPRDNKLTSGTLMVSKIVRRRLQLANLPCLLAIFWTDGLTLGIGSTECLPAGGSI